MLRTTRFAALLAAAAVAAAPAAGDYVTERWGNAEACGHRGTVKLTDGVLSFDLSALPAGAKVHRAVLVPKLKRRGHEEPVVFAPLTGKAPDGGPAEGESLALVPPYYRSFDATAAVRAWAADRTGPLRLRAKSAPGLSADRVFLDVSYDGRAARPVPAVEDLKAHHEAGQTFLTWKEIADPVGRDDPTFEDFHNVVMAAREKRGLTYYVYRSDRPISVETLASAERVLEVPQIVSCWNLKAVRNTEHANQGTPTMKSPLRPGYNNARNHVMTRYRIADGGEPLPRATGLAVVTAVKGGKRYYAVTAAVDGAEAVREIRTVGPADEKVAPFPAIIFQRSVGGGKDARGRPQRRVDVYNSWIGEPYYNVPTEAETYICRWRDLPKGTPTSRLPLWVVCGTYGSTAATMQNPGWYGARRHLTGALTVGLAEGRVWQGFHECIGTLRSYHQGVVHNYPQRRVLGAAAWGVWKKDFFVDPQRVYVWGQLNSWALRHGDVFAVVMSNGYGNYAIGKLAQNWSWQWGPRDQPLGSKNSAGVPQWVYMDLPKWVRENPKVELPYWLCWPAYGAYPNHTVGDFGFLPWPETLHAMHSTKRAFAAVWNSNGPGRIRGLLPLVTRIRRDQSLPAFGRCNLDASPGDGDHADAQKSGGINLYQLWEPETIVDEPARWEITLKLRKDCPADVCVTDVTPRRCQAFKAEPGAAFAWTVTDLPPDGKAEPGRPAPPWEPRELQSGRAVADQWGLVTAEGVRIPRAGCRLRIAPRR